MIRDEDDFNDFNRRATPPIDDDDGICDHGKYYYQFCGVCDAIEEAITNEASEQIDDAEAPSLEFEDEEC